MRTTYIEYYIYRGLSVIPRLYIFVLVYLIKVSYLIMAILDLARSLKATEVKLCIEWTIALTHQNNSSLKIISITIVNYLRVHPTAIIYVPFYVEYVPVINKQNIAQ